RAPVPAPAPDPSPAMPLPGTSPSATPAGAPEPQPAENPFFAVVRHAYLVDPEINPVGAPDSREKGIRLVATGSIRNNTDKLIYRAGAFTKLIAVFDRDSRFEKHSSGLGFDPPVTSTNPWRPGSWRDFRIVGRSFDPIYREYEPQAIAATLSLEAKDPIGYSFSGELVKLKPRWEGLFGLVVQGDVTLNADVTAVYGPGGRKMAAKAGDSVRLHAQQGAGFLAEREGELFGWISAEALNVPPYESLYPAEVKGDLPLSIEIPERYRVRVLEYGWEPKIDGLPEAAGGYMTFRVRVTNIAERQAAQIKPGMFWVDQGSGRGAEALDRTASIAGSLETANRVAPGETADGTIYVPRHVNGWPFALVFQPASHLRGHALLLPALAPELARGAKEAT
ncbi:hypothetical protein K8I61_11130, partial [bacterium]|nr:hypothetical protein [bacterium]